MEEQDKGGRLYVLVGARKSVGDRKLATPAYTIHNLMHTPSRHTHTHSTLVVSGSQKSAVAAKS